MHRIGKIICCAVLCVPLIAAIIIGITSENTQLPGSTLKGSKDNENRFVKVRICSEDGTFINEYDSNDVLEEYYNVISNGSVITDYLVDDSSTTFNVTLVGTQSEAVYTFIMSSDKIGNCVYKDIDEKIYSISSEDAKSLLMRDEFAAANKYAGVIDLKLSYNKDSEIFNQIVSGDVYNWNYTRLDGEIITKVDSEPSSDLQTVIVPKNTDFEVTFGSDIAPETVNMIVTNGTETVYTGEPGALSTYLNFTSDTLLSVTVDAKWHESEKSVYYGEVKYSFNLLYDVPSKFVLADKALAAGEFTVIKVSEGITTREVIRAESEIMTGVTESFVHNGNRYIYIPIKPTTEPGTYQIKLTEFAGVSTVDFTVRSKTFKTYDNLLVTPDVAELATSVNVTEFNELLEQYKHSTSAQQLWKDKFMMPVENGTAVCSFGDTLNIPANVKISDGMYISGAAGASVRAANDGVVLFAGETKYSGNTVIIDHGLGVLSYYFNLGDVSCTQGDNITRGSTIGTIGTSGFTPFTNTVLYANSVCGCFVNPKTQLDYGIYFG